jgi:hypothetical protein
MPGRFGACRWKRPPPTCTPFLLYTGAAWGAGAFLVMPDLPVPALVFSFAVAPSLVLTLVLRDAKGSEAFVAPASLVTAGAALMGDWPRALWVATAIITAGVALIVPAMLRRAMRRNVLPQPALR